MARLKRVQANEGTTPRDTTPDATPSQTTPSAKKPRRRRGRTSSERGKAFRKRQDNQEALVEQQVVRLKQEIRDKQFLLSVYAAKCLRSKHSIQGPLVKIAVEYFRMFQFGLQSSSEAAACALPGYDSDLIRRQEACAHSILDPDVTNGSDARGPDAVLDQWRRYTLAAPDFSCEIASIPMVLGSDDNPVVQLQLLGRFTIGSPFIAVIFEPSARSHASRLLQRSMNKTLTLAWRFYLQFSAEKRIQCKIARVDYVQSFLDLGMALDEVAELLKISRLTLYSTIEPREAGSKQEEKARPAAGA